MNPLRPLALLPLAAALLLGGCLLGHTVRPAPQAELAAERARAGELLERLRPLCGQAFAGRIVADTPRSADDPFIGKTLVMHVRGCEDDAIRVPFQVGEDRSRTWVFQHLAIGLSLKHDHRHRDGSEDELTMYGGELKPGGAPGRYEFPADSHSRALFRRLGREVSVPNVWAVEIDAQRFVYELARPGRLFRVEFDLTRPVPAPPPPWGG
ncbi:hypothetical protein [Lysobacter yananisis]|uniref:hypothetical protein n=1 Tax=Lysobacter yananisis TaxID=1003114 RepID=UPI003CE524B2